MVKPLAGGEVAPLEVKIFLFRVGLGEEMYEIISI